MSGEPELAKGVSDEWVLHAQQVMQAGERWDGPTDGVFDDDFERAVLLLQEHGGVPPTGVLDLATWELLEGLAHQQNGHAEQYPETAVADGAGNHPVLYQGMTGDWVVYLQQLLQQRGLWNGPCDGSYDDSLGYAVSVLQGSCGLSQTGMVDAATWQALEGSAQQQDQFAVGNGTAPSVAEMTATQKLVEAYNRADIEAAFRDKILSLFTPEAVVTAVVTAGAVFAASQLTPVGWAADIGIAVTAVFTGAVLYNVGGELLAFAEARNATTEAELDAAGAAFARAAAEFGVDAFLFFLACRVGAPAAGRAPYEGPPPSGMLLAATPDGQLVLVAVESIPVEVSAQLGITAAAAMMGGSGGGGDEDLDRYEEEYGDHPLMREPSGGRISTGRKPELQESGWLRRRLPDPARRKEFMDWIRDRNRTGGPGHEHQDPGSQPTQELLDEFLAESPGGRATQEGVDRLVSETPEYKPEE
ncbi:MAG TPA: peptidoglycan-binding protein [Actinophytocola sp.]|uniref:peptidoglycan-binding domain-containing protein n=1 Tax=Actinophytocola sp. TaxID=1872138 RepID=UPI002DC02E55|nr:peptidoglycan-binding protein [Actinophytocola sp.]HEU5472577.1 peptidoglycan-binding protein [Actinophytocola sp.]